MKIVPSFGEEFPIDDGLLAIKFDENELNEFEVLFELWNDTEFLMDFCNKNKADIFNGIFKIGNLEAFILAIKAEALELERILHLYASRGQNLNGRYLLENIFQQFHASQTPSTILQQSDVRVNRNYTKVPLLRIYALKLGANCFVVTGGAIKIYATTNESFENTKVIARMNSVRDYLREANIECQAELKYFYDYE